MASRILDALDWKKMSHSHKGDNPWFLLKRIREHPVYQRYYGANPDSGSILPEGFSTVIEALRHEASSAYLWDKLSEDFDPPFDRPKSTYKDDQREEFSDGTILTDNWPDRSHVFMSEEDLMDYLDWDSRRPFPQF